MRKLNTGFDGRVFLEEYEWLTYQRRLPVRRIRGRTHKETCFTCGGAPSDDKPFEHSHRIGFALGVVELGLTPEFLDGPWNIVSAHRGACNKAAEMTVESAATLLVSLGHTLPDYLVKPSRQSGTEPQVQS